MQHSQTNTDLEETLENSKPARDMHENNSTNHTFSTSKDAILATEADTTTLRSVDQRIFLDGRLLSHEMGRQI
jgi:hypothetical protein